MAIDGKSKGTFDLYSLNTTFDIQRTFSGLSAKPHTIVVKVKGKKNASSADFNVVVDAFVVGSVTTEDGSRQVSYNTWVGGADPGANGGTFRSDLAKKATASLTFTGTSINWITATGPTYGKADVLIDNVDMGTVDLFSPAQHWQILKTYSNLPAVQHTIQVRVLAVKNKSSKGKAVVVDGFSGPIVASNTHVPSSPMPDDSASASDNSTSWLLLLLPVGMVAVAWRKRRQHP